MTRLTVVYGAEFLDAARRRYPADHSMSCSGPTYGEFMAYPVRAARLRFGDEWEDQPAEAGGTVRFTITQPSGPIVFYAALVTSPFGARVEIQGFEDDPGYEEMFLDDPDT